MQVMLYNVYYSKHNTSYSEYYIILKVTVFTIIFTMQVTVSAILYMAQVTVETLLVEYTEDDAKSNIVHWLQHRCELEACPVPSAHLLLI